MSTTNGRTCRNCDALLQGDFCHVCGQRAATRLPTLFNFVASGIATVMDVDGPIWTSLRTLVLRPGALSVDFLEGRRTSTLHPAQLFVAVALLALAPRALVQRDLEQGGMVYIFTAGIATAIGQEWAQILALVVAAPVMAAAVKVLYLRRGRRFLEHLVVTIEFFTLVLLVGTIETFGVILAGGGSAQLFAAAVAASALTLAAALTLRRVYGSTALESIVGVIFLGVCAGTGILFAVELM